MRTLLLATAAIAALCGPAIGADLPNPLAVKAPVVTSLWDTGGWYAGLETGAAVANSQVSGSNSLFSNGFVNGSLNSDGAYIGGVVGYMRGNAAHWYAGECDANWRNVSGGGVAASVGGNAIVATSLASRWSAGCEVRVGGSVDPLSLLGTAASNLGLGITFPTFNPVPPPGAHVAAAPRTYIAAGGEVFGVSGEIGAAGGADVVWAPRVRMGALWQQLNTAGTPTGGVFDVSGKVVFASKGLEFSNVFDPTNRAMFAGQAHMGNLYAVEMRYMFSPGGIAIASR